MKLKTKWLFLTIFLVLAIPMSAGAGQIYHGDGATPSGTTVLGWSNGSAAGQCLYCHKSGGSATDESTYLMTGHKNMLRKVTPGAPWAGADGIPYGTGDPGAYGQPVLFDWTAGTVSGTDSPPSILAGSLIYYVLGGYMDPTQMNTIFAGGFTGEISGDYGVTFPGGNYDCAYCHTTGYQFDKSAPEPTTYLGDPISDLNFSRIPGIFADSSTTPGTIACTDLSGTCSSSWHLDGIQCERCHNADDGVNNHTLLGTITPGGTPTKPTLQNATALCIECHRQQMVDPTVGNNTITLSTDLMVSGNFCSDGTSPDYPTCVAGGGTWTAPFFDTEPGQTFLNSPHARFTGTMAQTAQDSPDLSVSMTGSYNSAFSTSGSNRGCDGCHNVHQSTIEAVNAVAPFTKKCTDCHTSNGDAAAPQIVVAQINHPSGIGTPLENVSTEPSRPCIICHMQSGSGTPIYHLMRINVDASYSTFPTAIQPQPQIGNTASDGKIAAVWADLDLACGKCHGGTLGASTSVNGAPYLTKAIAAQYANGIHDYTTTTAPDIQTIIPALWGTNPATGNPNQPIQPPSNCATPLAVNGTLTVAAPGSCVLTTCSGTISTLFTFTPSSAGSAGMVQYVNWGDGTPTSTTLTHTYATPSNYQITETATDPCGNRQTKTFAANVTGGANGKGTLTISAAGTASFNMSYNVMDGSTSVTNGTLAVGGSKSITLDAKAYTVTIGYASVLPLTDPLTYHSCTTPAGGTLSANLSTVTGIPETVPLGGTATLNITGCNN